MGGLDAARWWALLCLGQALAPSQLLPTQALQQQCALAFAEQFPEKANQEMSTIIFLKNLTNNFNESGLCIWYKEMRAWCREGSAPVEEELEVTAILTESILDKRI